MQGPGAEYLVILNDRQLWEGQVRQRSRATRSRRLGFNWPLLNSLRRLPSRGVGRFEAIDTSTNDQFAPSGREVLFGSSD
jgi:hypothetical protein